MIFGRDARQAALLDILRADGHEAYPYDGGLPALPETGLSAAVLPMPLADGQGLTEDEEALLDTLSKFDLCVGGRIPESFLACARERGIRLFDYARREDFAVSNALTTAEAALCIAMEHADHVLQGQSALVVGYGRIGRCLARLLRALGLRVSVSARKSADLAWIRAEGCDALDTRALPALESFDLIFNTVPAPVLGPKALASTKPDCLLIDLASAPGGVDFDAAKALSRCAVHALRLPGAYAPRSAARSAADSIYAILAEEEHGE